MARGSPVVDPISNARPGCPRCGSRTPHRWGTFAGRQRYRCSRCGKTFSDLTGSPFQHARDLASWHPFMDCLARGCSLRDTALHCGISLSTAFRRRHRILSWRTGFEEAARPLRGCVGLHELRIPESFKGSKRLPRPPRAHALPWRERFRAGPNALILVLAQDRLASPGWGPRRGRVRMAGVVGRPPHAATLRRCLGRNLSQGACLHPAISPSWEGWPSRPLFPHNARETRGCERSGSTRGRPELMSGMVRGMTESVVTYRQRMRQWLPRFRGVSTRYLPHYLVWFEIWAAVFQDEGDLERWREGGSAREKHEWEGGPGYPSDLHHGGDGHQMLMEFLA